jgi:antitoxin PrlF
MRGIGLSSNMGIEVREARRRFEASMRDCRPRPARRPSLSPRLVSPTSSSEPALGLSSALTSPHPGITLRAFVMLGGPDMADATTMTTKGQVTVPREIRDRLGLKSGDKMAFTMLSDGTVVMRPKTRRLADLAGSLTRPGQPKVAIKDMNPFKATAAAKRMKRPAR